ncbi:MAG: cadherin domain-containing protein, partial [Ekhidna sp.]|nr:cadherin domain-containing protein [Ekhidna sp.]
SNGTLSGTAQITVNVTDANEAPTINAQIFSIEENAAAGTAVGTVAATDEDGGDEMTFSITSGNTDDAFQIDAVSGEVTVKTSALLDYEIKANRTFTLMVQVSDGATPADAAVTINVKNVNEAPEISNQTFSIAENAAVDVAVGTVAASDADGDNLTFAITNGNAIGNSGDVFNINANSGAITVAKALDYETTPTYTLTVRVSDRAAFSMAAVTINVTNVNEAPEISNQTFSIAENAAVDVAVGTVAASDADGDNLTFAITSGNTDNAFQIDAVSGEITVKTAALLDYEIKANRTFTLMVQVSDGTTPADAAVTINVTNENDNAPTYVLAQSVTVALDAKVDTLVGTLMATDADGDKLTFVGQGGLLVNRMLSTPGITIDGDTGEITVTDDLTKFYSSGTDTALLFDVTDGKFTTLGGQVTISFQ